MTKTIQSAIPNKPPVPKRDIKEVWNEYKRTKAEPLRNYLMEQYLHLVRYNAERIHVKLPDEVELDDLMSAGIFGLMDAIAAFDMERGVKFETYCAPRIRGAILDELRSMDWVPPAGPARGATRWTARPSSSKSNWAGHRRTRSWPSSSRCRWPSSTRCRRTPAPSAW